MEIKADITGLMVKPKLGWELRCKELALPDFFSVGVVMREPLLSELTNDELERLLPKIELVKEAARYMLAGMVKGTLKYDADNLDIDTWMAHLLGEGADQMNYQMLLVNEWRERAAEYSEPGCP